MTVQISKLSLLEQAIFMEWETIVMFVTKGLI